MGEKEPLSFMQILDDLIERINSLRTIFIVLILCSLILSPIAILLSLIIILHPAFIMYIIFKLKQPGLGWLILFSAIISMLLSIITLYFSIKEYRFFRNWSTRFNRYLMSRKNIEEELEKSSTT